MATNQGVGSSNLSGRAINKYMKKFILIIFIFIYSNTIFSHEKIKGIGLSKCVTFTSASIEDKVIYISWMAGFMTSHNILKHKLHAKNITYNRSQIWVESFCYNNPNKKFKEAVESFINEFTK